MSVALAISGCGSNGTKKIADILFEGKPGQPNQPAPEPVVREPRRPPAYDKTPQVESPGIDASVLAKHEFFQKDWSEFMRQLPHDPAGQVDWVTALNDDDIDPAPGPGKDAVESPVLAMDVVLEPEAVPQFRVVFPHEPHTQWLTCSNCHTGIFQMQKGADDISMAAIFSGQYCGVCHGKVAFAVATGCARCHPALAGPS